MANIKSAKKQARQDIKRRVVNTNRKSGVKTVVKKLLLAIEKGDSLENVKAIFKSAEASLSRAKRKVMHPNTASRKISRLAHKVLVYAKGLNS